MRHLLFCPRVKCVRLSEENTVDHRALSWLYIILYIPSVKVDVILWFCFVLFGVEKIIQFTFSSLHIGYMK